MTLNPSLRDYSEFLTIRIDLLIRHSRCLTKIGLQFRSFHLSGYLKFFKATIKNS